MADDGKEADSGEDARMSSDTGGCEVAQVGLALINDVILELETKENTLVGEFSMIVKLQSEVFFQLYWMWCY